MEVVRYKNDTIHIIMHEGEKYVVYDHEICFRLDEPHVYVPEHEAHMSFYRKTKGYLYNEGFRVESYRNVDNIERINWYNVTRTQEPSISYYIEYQKKTFPELFI